MKSQNIQENNKEQTLFSLEKNSISEILMQNGTTGNTVAYQDTEDIRKIIKILDDFKYEDTEKISQADGWSYRITITETTDGNTSFYLDESNVYIENICYISSKKDYFSNFVNTWMPK